MNVEPLILVVDDEPDNFDVIEILLAGEGYQLSYASSGKNLMDRLNLLKPDVILMDVMMPEVDGMVLCEQIRADEQFKMIPIIVLTALTAKEDLANCLAVGADDFISKPVNGLELRARVKSMVRIKQQYDDLKTLLKLREDMAHMIVHDLRIPLTNMVLSTRMLQTQKSPEKRETMLNRIVMLERQMQGLIDNILIASKLESTSVSLNYSATDLNWLCSMAAGDFEMMATQKELQLIAQLPAVGGSVMIDATIFRRIIDNLLVNAIKFSPKGSQVILRASYLEKGGAIVQVIDTGTGVNSELKQRIFDKYETGNLLQDTPQIGLGLAFCKLAIEAHQGQITLEDNQPHGAIFSVLLPGNCQGNSPD